MSELREGKICFYSSVYKSSTSLISGHPSVCFSLLLQRRDSDKTVARVILDQFLWVHGPRVRPTPPRPEVGDARGGGAL